MSLAFAQAVKRPLDPGLLELNEEEARFFKACTGIQDDEELRKHIVSVQARAYEVHGYPCIRKFSFASLRFSRLPAYNRALELSRAHPGAILLDIGCCFGNVLRKAVMDGWPVENTIGSDLQLAFWNCGHELFNSTPDSFPAAFVPGDVFDPALIQPREPFYVIPASSHPADLRSLTSLTPLQGHISVIHATSFFHLFDEEKQLLAAKQLATLLSPASGSMIFGGHGGRPIKGLRTEVNNLRGGHMFCHSEESWKDMWDGQVFNKGSVKVETKLVERPSGIYPNVISHWLMWSIMRL